MPLRHTVIGTVLSTGVSATTRGRRRISVTSLPSNLVTTSPDWILALSAGPFSVTRATSAPLRPVEAEALGDLVGHGLDVDAEPAAPRLAVLAQLVDDRLGQRRGDGEADADGAAGRRVDRGVDADDLAGQVEHRAAGIAAVDRRVGLEEVVIGAGVDVARARRDDAGGDRAAEAERIADRQHPVADPRLVGIAELHDGSGLVDLDLAAPRDRSWCRCRPPWPAELVLSCRMTLISSASAMTWLLVTMKPVGSTMKPEPSDCGAARRLLVGRAAGGRRSRGRTPRTASRAGIAAPRGRGGAALARRPLALRGALGLHGLRGGDVDHRRQQPLGQIGEARHRRRRCVGAERPAGRWPGAWASAVPAAASGDDGCDEAAANQARGLDPAVGDTCDHLRSPRSFNVLSVRVQRGPRPPRC